jgi:epoxyqueuosine reductase
MLERKDEDYDELLRGEALGSGAALFGVAKINSERESFHEEITRGTSGLKYAISMGAVLSLPVLETIIDRPTHIYKTHYRHTNMFLDNLATRISSRITTLGFEALPIAASYIVDWKKQTSHLSHKRIAQLAGLGWLGRNNLLVNPRFGSAIRLVTVLTDIPLNPGPPRRRDCGECRACLEVCPVGAIKERPEEFDHMACFEQLRKFSQEANFGQHICGLCVKVCRGDSGRDRET